MAGKDAFFHSLVGRTARNVGMRAACAGVCSVCLVPHIMNAWFEMCCRTCAQHGFPSSSSLEN